MRLEELFPYRQTPRRRQVGVALVLALWILVLLTVMASSFSLNIRRNTELVRNAKDRAQGLALAEGALHYSMMMLLLPDLMQRWRADGTIYELTLADARIRVQLYDEAGKFDINYIQEKLWYALLEGAGIEHDEAVHVTDAIMDWKDTDNFRRLHGAEEKAYEAAGLNYGPRNQPFRSIEELQQVLGVSEKLYDALEPMITIHSKQKGVDLSKASKEVLMVMPELNEDILEAFLNARRESATNKTPAPPPPAVLGVRAGGADRAYSVRVDARLPDGYTSSLLATIMRQQSVGQSPFSVLSWKTFVAGSENLFDQNEDAEFPLH